jgi:hypothetical protein
MNYSTIFNKDLYSLLFNNNEVKILYKNELVDSTTLMPCEITSDISIIEDIKLILNKFINKDLSVKNDCINIPIYINKLFEIICNKENKENKENKVLCSDSCYNILNLHNTIFNEIFNNIHHMQKENLKEINDFINTHDVIISYEKDNILLRYIIVMFINNFNSIINYNSYCCAGKIYVMYRFYNFLVKNRFYMDDIEKFKLEKLNENNRFDIEKFKVITLNKINGIKLDIERHYKHLIIYNEINKVFDEITKYT